MKNSKKMLDSRNAYMCLKWILSAKIRILMKIHNKGYEDYLRLVKFCVSHYRKSRNNYRK